MSNQKRIHGIDSLRAVAMLLGIFLHASIAYKAKPHRNWIYDEQYHSWAYSLLYFLIHSFRMPLFFIVAGFFCRLLFYKVGEREFILRRWKRVGIPFLAGLLLVVPLSLIPYKMYFFMHIQGIAWEPAWNKSLKGVLSFNGLAHLWFLYDLLLFYAVTVVFLRIKKFTVVQNLATRFSNWWRGFRVERWFIPAFIILPLWLCMLREQELFPVTDTYIIPRRIHNLFYYGFLFLVGWLFHKRQDVFGLLERNYAAFLYPGLFCCAAVFYVEWNSFTAGISGGWLLLKLAAAIQVTLLSLGAIGFFLRFFNNESKFWLYVSDASYWVYLVHLVIVTGLQFLFLNSEVPGPLRFPIIILVTVFLTFISYHWFVRYTFIGNLLHGPRKRKVKLDTPLNATFKNG